MGKQRGSCSHRYCLRACYVPGIVLGTEDTAQNKTKSLSPRSQNSAGQPCTLWAFSHFVVPFQLHYAPGPSVCSLPQCTPINSSQGKEKGALSTPSPHPSKPWHPEWLSAQPRTKAGGDIMCLIPGCEGSRHHPGLDLTLVSCPWEQWFRGVFPRTPTKDGKWGSGQAGLGIV